MSTSLQDSSIRRTVYMLLITVAAGLVGGRILGVARIYEPKDPDKWESNFGYIDAQGNYIWQPGMRSIEK